MSFFNFFRRRKTLELDRVSFTDDMVTRVRPDGVQETVRWDDLCEVAVITTDGGPWFEDVFFLLIGSGENSGCAVPLSAEGRQKLFERLQQLPGFNNEAVMKAMGSTSNDRFLCWKREVK